MMRTLVLWLALVGTATAASVTFDYSPIPLPDGTPYTSYRAWRCIGGYLACPVTNRRVWFVANTWPTTGCQNCLHTVLEPMPTLLRFKLSYYLTARIASGAETAPSNVVILQCDRSSGRLRCD